MGIVLIAFYHFLAATFYVLFALTPAVGGSVLGPMFAAGTRLLLGGMGVYVGVVGAPFTLVFAVVAALVGYGVWMLRQWGRILCIVLAGISILLLLFPALLFMGLHWFFVLGRYRLINLAISVLTIWYLMQPQIRSLFQRSAPALP
jgi:hypothetical protein